jgi:hypothetical protein
VQDAGTGTVVLLHAAGAALTVDGLPIDTQSGFRGLRGT